MSSLRLAGRAAILVGMIALAAAASWVLDPADGAHARQPTSLEARDGTLGAADALRHGALAVSPTAPLDATPERELGNRYHPSRLAAGFFCGLLVALALYSLLLFVAIGETGFLLYVAILLNTGLAGFAAYGLALQYLWPDAVVWNQRAPQLFGFFALAFAGQFTRSMLDLPRRLARTLTMLAAAAALLALLSLWPLTPGASAGTLLVLAAAIALAGTAAGVVAWRRRFRAGWWLLLAWAALLTGVAAAALRIADLLPATALTLEAAPLGAAMATLLLPLALAGRLNALKRDGSQAQAAALAASQRSAHEIETLVRERVGELQEMNRALQSEIGDRRRAEEALFEMAHHDALTGAPNRLLLKDRFELAAAQAERTDTLLALLMLDLDGFKRINDTLGHDVGDRVLVRFTEVLRASVRTTDTVARLGGDEFVILLGNLHDADEAARVPGTILRSLASASRVPERAVGATASIGVALYPQDGTTLDGLLKCADIAMYRAKQAGGNTCFFFVAGTQRQLSLPEAG